MTLAVQLVKDASISIEGKDQQDKKALLQKCASTTLNSKLVGFLPWRAADLPRVQLFGRLPTSRIHSLSRRHHVGTHRAKRQHI